MVRISLDHMSRDPGRYFRDVEAGETIVVTRGGQPVAEIRPMAMADKQPPHSPRPVGLAAGDFRVPDDFDAPLPADVLDSFEAR